jgi:NADH-quinone oxidoreductase subunit C
MDRESIIQQATQLIGDRAERVETPSPDRLDFYMTNIDELEAIVAELRARHFGYLSCVTGLDLGVEAGNFEILYQFCEGPLTFTLRYQVPRTNGSIPTLTRLIPGAEAFERELSEMFGLLIAGRQTDYLYLPDDWTPGLFPLRKDFDAGQLKPTGN